MVISLGQPAEFVRLAASLVCSLACEAKSFFLIKIALDSAINTL